MGFLYALKLTCYKTCIYIAWTTYISCISHISHISYIIHMNYVFRYCMNYLKSLVIIKKKLNIFFKIYMDRSFKTSKI